MPRAFLSALNTLSHLVVTINEGKQSSLSSSTMLSMARSPSITAVKLLVFPYCHIKRRKTKGIHMQFILLTETARPIAVFPVLEGSTEAHENTGFGRATCSHFIPLQLYSPGQGW